MTPDRLEELFEKMVEQNDEIIGALQNIDTNLDRLNDALGALTEKLEAVDTTLDGVHDKLSDIHGVVEQELDWTKPNGSSKLVLDQLKRLVEQLGRGRNPLVG